MKCYKLIILLGLFLPKSVIQSVVVDQEARYKEIYQLAVGLARKKEFSSAINYFDYLLKINPEDDKVRYLQAKAYYLNNSAYKALMVCNSVSQSAALKKCSELKLKAKREYPNEHLLFDAYRLLNQGKFEKSIKIVDQLIELDSYNPKYRFILGKILHSQGDLYRAYDHYTYVKDFVSRRRRSKIQKSINKLLDSVRPLVEYIKKTHPKSADIELDEYWQMYCLAIHVSTSEIAKNNEHLADDAISFLKAALENEKLESSKRFSLIMPMLNLYSLRGEAERAYNLLSLAKHTNPKKADRARLDFAEELLRVRHPMFIKSTLTRSK